MTKKIPYPALKPKDWSEPDQLLWRAARQPEGLVNEAGIAAEWSPAYAANLELFYGQLLTFLASTDGLDEHATPIQRVTPETVRKFIDAFSAGRSDGTLVTVLHGIAAFVWACHHPEGVPWLTALALKYKRRAQRQRPLASRTASIDELVWLGETLIREGRERIATDRKAGAKSYRDGLIILALVLYPIRRKNLAALQLGKTILAVGDRFRISFAASATKNGVELDRLYPTWLSAHIQFYLDEVRPILRADSNKPDEGWLWIGRKGERLRDQSIRVITTSHTRARIGRPVPPHNFRHSVATDIACLDAEHVGITKDLLGHRTSKTTEQVYILASRLSAFTEFHAIFEKRRARK